MIMGNALATKPELYEFAENGGSDNAIGDYSSAATYFTLTPASGEIFMVHRMLVSVGDSGFRADRYGGLASSLTNGIDVQIRDASGLVLSLTGGNPITTNAGWGRCCYDVDVKSWGAGPELLVARWSFDKAGQPIRLSGDRGEFIAVELNDDMTGLTDHRFFFQGTGGARSEPRA